MALLAVFTAAVAISLRRGNTSISCACFGGKREARLSAAHVLRNVLLGATALGALTTGGGDAAPSAGALASVLTGFVLAWLVVETVQMRSQSMEVTR